MTNLRKLASWGSSALHPITSTAPCTAATTTGQAVHPAYRGKSFKVHQEQATDVYLTEDELARMRALDLTPHPKGIALSRDLFMIGCYTGLRVSDYSRLQADQFHMRYGKRYLEVQAKKTGKRVVVPVHPVVDEILRHYTTGVPPSQVDQTINRHLKLLGESADSMTSSKSAAQKVVKR